MTIHDDQLFDPDIYGPGKQLRSSELERSAQRVQIPIERLEAGWRLIRQRRGVLPFAHLVRSTTDLNGVLTMCGQRGTTLPRFEDDQGARCPICDMEAQL